MQTSNIITILAVTAGFAQSQVVYKTPANCVTEEEGKDCVFPFTYKDVEYYECTYTDSPTPWCATQVDPSGTVVTNKWGDCKVDTCPVEESSSCKTIGGPDIDQPCSFPFTIGNETYHECVTGRILYDCVKYLLWGIIEVTKCKVVSIKNNLW